MAELGVLFLMFLAGLELHFSEMAHNSRVGIFAGSFGVIFPIGVGYLMGLFLDLSQTQALFLGLSLGATSVSISAHTLLEMQVLRTRVGLGLLGAAVLDDILVILFLSTFLAFMSGASGFFAIFLILLKMVAFLLLSSAFGFWILPKISQAVSSLGISQGILTLALIFLLIYGVTAEYLGGMAAITGAFIAGLMFARTPQKAILDVGMRAIAYSFFVPIFFVDIGLAVDLHSVPINVIGIMVMISILAIFSKLFGAAIGARLGGFSWLESFQLGMGMISRGEVGLIVAQVGFSEGLMTVPIYSSVVGMVIVTTLVTPPLLRLFFSQRVLAFFLSMKKTNPKDNEEVV